MCMHACVHAYVCVWHVRVCTHVHIVCMCVRVMCMHVRAHCACVCVSGVHSCVQWQLGMPGRARPSTLACGLREVDGIRASPCPTSAGAASLQSSCYLAILSVQDMVTSCSPSRTPSHVCTTLGPRTGTVPSPDSILVRR